MMTPEYLADRFRARRGVEPTFWAMGPGRVNLIGEHTDYNDGYVLPAAIDRYIGFAGTTMPGMLCRIFSEALDQRAEFDLGNLHPSGDNGFEKYAAGVAWVLGSGKALTAIDVDLHSDLPLASGVSSSAAFEMASAATWNHLDNLGLETKQMALAGQKAENEYVGLKCGIMDQLASAAGKRGHCLLIDTRNLAITPVAIPPDLALVVCDTGKPRGLTDTAYNERWEQCHQAAAKLGVQSLRDATMELLESDRPKLTEVEYRRAKHVVGENDRVLQFVHALQCSDRVHIGSLMADSHSSLRFDYEVSCGELDVMVEAGRNSPGCVGIRMTGAGFGGCCVALVDRNDTDEFVSAIKQGYVDKVNLTPSFLVCEAAQGAAAGTYG
jgi:galactokinase